jgi:hypothetical protein
MTTLNSRASYPDRPKHVVRYTHDYDDLPTEYCLTYVDASTTSQRHAPVIPTADVHKICNPHADYVPSSLPIRLLVAEPGISLWCIVSQLAEVFGDSSSTRVGCVTSSPPPPSTTPRLYVRIGRIGDGLRGLVPSSAVWAGDAQVCPLPLSEPRLLDESCVMAVHPGVPRADP